MKITTARILFLLRYMVLCEIGKRQIPSDIKVVTTTGDFVPKKQARIIFQPRLYSSGPGISQC